MGGLGESLAPMGRTRRQDMTACYRSIKAAGHQLCKYTKT